MKLTEKDIKWVMKNWDKIPDDFKSNIKPNDYSSIVKDLKLEEHIVVLLLDEQRPSVQADYSFDEERVGVTRTGKIIWGFDSGCSCPSPWNDSYPDCYHVEKTWKEFEVKAKEIESGKSKYDYNDNAVFDTGWSERAKAKLEEIKKKITGE
jgi:hypothetical protein